MQEGHVVVDDAIVLGGKLEEVVHVGDDERVVEVRERELRLANAGGPMKDDGLGLKDGGVDGAPAAKVIKLVIAYKLLGVKDVTGNSESLVVTHHAGEVLFPELVIACALLELVLDSVQVRALALTLVLEWIAPLVEVTLLQKIRVISSGFKVNKKNKLPSCSK